MFAEALDHSFIQRALWAAAVIGFANGFLSGFIVIRRSALMVGSMSHSLLPGIAIAVLLAGLTPLTAFVGALTSALLVGLGALFLSRTSRIDGNTSLAVLYTGAFALGLLILDQMPLQVELEHWLFGNILALSDGDLRMAWVAAAIILGSLALFGRPIIITLFEGSIAASQGIPVRRMQYLLTALVILGLVVSIQAVGCILSVAMLVAPAAAVYQFANSPLVLIWGGGILGAITACTAVLLSYHWNLRIGAGIVLLLSISVFLAYLFSPRYGALRRWLGSPPAPHPHDTH